MLGTVILLLLGVLIIPRVQTRVAAWRTPAAEPLGGGSRVMSAFSSPAKVEPQADVVVVEPSVTWATETACIALFKAHCNLRFYPGRVQRTLWFHDRKPQLLVMPPLELEAGIMVDLKQRALTATLQEILQQYPELEVKAKRLRRSSSFTPPPAAVAGGVVTKAAEAAAAPAEAAPEQIVSPKVIATYEGTLSKHGMEKHQPKKAGEDPYKCYCADLNTEEGPVRALGVDIARAIEESGAELGDFVELKKHGKVQVVIPAETDDAGNVVKREHKAFKNLFSCSILRKAQKAA